MKTETKKITLCAMFIALSIVIAQICHHSIPESGRILSPMHFTVMICGLLLGWKYGLICGLVAPLINALGGIPPFIPTALGMAFELATYGAISGLCIKLLKIFKEGKLQIINIYIALLIAMVAGRVVGGLYNVIYYGLGSGGYAFTTFLTAYIVTPLPSIVLQVILIPLIVNAINNNQTINKEQTEE